jgi:hypothetical protein
MRDIVQQVRLGKPRAVYQEGAEEDCRNGRNPC